MVTPYVSLYDTSPWQPTVYTSDSDASDQQTAAGQYDQVYGGSYITADGSAPSGGSVPSFVHTPDVYMAYTQAPDFVPTASSQSMGSDISDADVYDTMPFYIDLAALRAAEQACLNATSDAIDAYHALVPMVTGAIFSQTIFGQHVGQMLVNGVWTDTGENWYDANGNSHGQMGTDPLNQEGQDFAAATNPGMTQLCQSICGVLELWGVFNALLNNTGQMYTYTDSTCRFPPADHTASMA